MSTTSLNNPMVNNSQELSVPKYTLVTPTEGENPKELADFMKTEGFRKQILQIIRSLSKTEPATLEEDANPLDNIIRKEVTNFLEFRRISKTKIKEAKNLITLGQNPYNNFTGDENLILLNQALALEYINQKAYIILLENPVNLYNRFPKAYKELLDFQEALPTNIPTIEELRLAGAVTFILDTVRENPESVIDEDLIEEYTNKYIDTVLLTSEFIGYTKATQVYANPNQTLLILTKTEFRNWARRVGLYLKFVTEEKIQAIEDLIPSQFLTIVDYFTPEQLRLMIDKEIDIKNMILKSITIKDLRVEFNKLAEEFKVAFEILFTNEKLMEMIHNALYFVYKDFDLNEFYGRMATITKTEFPQSRIDQIENYLQNI